MSIPVMQTGFLGGEISPSLYGQVNLEKERLGCTTARNMFVNYQGGVMSRAGTAFVGQSPTPPPFLPRLIPFQYSVTQGYVLELGQAVPSSSSTSLAIGTGSKTATVGTNLNLTNGQTVMLIDSANVSNYMYGTVASYTASTGSLTVTVSSVGGAGTFTTWWLAVPYMRFTENGGYIIEATNTVSAVGAADPCQITTSTAHGYHTGDWIYFAGGNIPQLQGNIYPVTYVDTTNFTLGTALSFGATGVDPSSWGGYSGGATCARVYTIGIPWMISDVPLVKWAQSADDMSIVHASYPPYELTRIANTNWTLAPTSFAAKIGAIPYAPTATASSGGSNYSNYVVTAVSAAGEESDASPICVSPGIDVFSIAYVLLYLQWTGAANIPAVSYNIYGTVQSHNQYNPVGSIMGYLGSTSGQTFVVGNIQPDFTKTPPTHSNPFAPGSVLYLQAVSHGSAYSQVPGAVTITITSATGSGFTGYGIISIQTGTAGQFEGVYITNGGSGYTIADSVVITDNIGSGSGATASILNTANGGLTPASGTYPGVVAYYQQRRVYAASQQQPNTYWMSRNGAYTNFDYAIPTNDSDAITGTPWSQQVNGIQSMMPMPTGLVVLTGNGAWLVSGGSGNGAITPSNQLAQAQAYNGCSPFVQPVAINYNILYVQEKGAIVRDLAYNFYAAIYTGTDRTVYSNHLFNGYSISQIAWAEEPYKLLWCVRSDGVLLCMTYMVEQQIYGWTRHDTQGQFVSAVTVSEPPVNALYTLVKRFNEAYYLERFNNRMWTTVEDSWCVDAGVAYPQPAPASGLIFAEANGTSNITSTQVTYGGSGYTAPTAAAVDSTGVGSGATFSVQFNAIGGIASVVLDSGGSGYSWSAIVHITDSSGSGTGGYITAHVTSDYVAYLTIVSAGSGYNLATTTLSITGAGSGAAAHVASLYTSATAAITGVTPLASGANYTPGDTSIIIDDPTGIGAVVYPVLTNYVTATAPSYGFSSNDVGAVIRAGGGEGTVVSVNAGVATINMVMPVLATVPNDPNNTPLYFSNLSTDYAPGGGWTLTTPTSTVYGLNHLEGQTVSILADGGVVPSQVVSGGSVTFPTGYPAASQIVMGLPFICQMQTPYMDVPQNGSTIQGRRKNINNVNVRVKDSRGFTVGINQTDAASQPWQANQTWTNMQEPKQRGPGMFLGQEIPLQTTDYFLPVSAAALTSDWDTRGQVAVQQLNPLPLNVTAIIMWVEAGDVPG